MCVGDPMGDRECRLVAGRDAAAVGDRRVAVALDDLERVEAAADRRRAVNRLESCRHPLQRRRRPHPLDRHDLAFDEPRYEAVVDERDDLRADAGGRRHQRCLVLDAPVDAE